MKRNNIFYKNLIFSMLFSLLITLQIFAEEKLENASNTSGIYYTGEKGKNKEVASIDATDVSKGWKEYYKNFIVELGAVKFSFYNKDGSLNKELKVLPPDSCFVQADNDKGVKRSADNYIEVYKAYIQGNKDLILGGYFPFGKCNYVYVGDCKSSANIPLMCYYDEDEIYNYFKPWENAKTGKEWIEENNGENLNKLCEELGVTFTNTSGSEVSALEWLGEGNSVVLEPLTFYPNATEEICCNVVSKASKYNLTANDPIIYALSGAYNKELTEQDRIDIKNGTYKGEDPVLIKYFLMDRWMHAGYVSNEDAIARKNGDYSSTSGDTWTMKHYLAIGVESKETREWLDIWHGAKQEFFDAIGDKTGENVSEKIVKAAQKVGKELNEEEVEKSIEDAVTNALVAFDKTLPYNHTIDYGIELMAGDTSAFLGDYSSSKYKQLSKELFYDTVGSAIKINLNDGLSQEEIDEINKKLLDKAYDIVIAKAMADSYALIKDSLNEQLSKLGEALKLKYDEEQKAYYWEEVVHDARTYSYVGLTYTETTIHRVEWVRQTVVDGILGGAVTCVIDTDHNQYATVITKSDNEKVKPVQDVLVSASVLKNEDPMRYGSAMICGQAVLGDEILIKFHSNLEQISDATGSIDDQYNLYAQIGSSEYTWQYDNEHGAAGAKVTKFPYTYPQDIASAYKNDDNESYKYSSYGTIK